MQDNAEKVFVMPRATVRVCKPLMLPNGGEDTDGLVGRLGSKSVASPNGARKQVKVKDKDVPEGWETERSGCQREKAGRGEQTKTKASHDHWDSGSRVADRPKSPGDKTDTGNSPGVCGRPSIERTSAFRRGSAVFGPEPALPRQTASSAVSDGCRALPAKSRAQVSVLGAAMLAVEAPGPWLPWH